MSSKTMTKTSQTAKKEAAKKTKETLNIEETSMSTKSDPKQEKKATSIKADEKIQAQGNAVMADIEEIEEQEEATATAASTSGGGNAAALAAANGSTEMSASFKNFRHHPDMENFYRFIYENDLRHEALAIIDEIMAEKQQRKIVKNSKAQPH